MLPARWLQVCSVYEEALALPVPERLAFLHIRCSGDQFLIQEVASLLAMEQQPGFLDSLPAVAQTSQDDFQPGAIIAARFRIVRPLGQGGMGCVYEVQDLQLDERVALKTIRPELASDPTFAARFRKEIQFAKRVTHRNVCRIHDVGFHGERIFLTMELLAGDTLAQRLKGKTFSIAEALPLIEQMARGLEAAHLAGVIHRDFKSANVILSADRDGVRAVITDFGLSQACDQSTRSDSQNITLPGEAAGTVDYMAPEQLTGGRITPATDLYALGIVIHEMVTGSRPFPSEPPLKAAFRRLHELPPSPTQLVRDLPRNWGSAILRCLEPQPHYRFQTSSELLAALHGARIRKPFLPGRSVLLASGLAALIVLSAAFLLRTVRSKQPPARLDWQQITNFADAATDPAFSPDGRLLAFKRGGNWFMTAGQIYLKMMPDGQPVQLTSDAAPKMAPVFSPDGTRVAFTTTINRASNWHTVELSALPGGGPPRVLLNNAEGLTWIDKDHILFSEARLPEPLMVVVTSTESRSSQRDVYVPENTNWMAHFSALSPDRKQVLVIEMKPGPGNNFSEFGPCRLVPFDGSTRGRIVGPNPSHCIAAAWSPDGYWMYFSARTDEKFHLWRQHVAGGSIEQVTSGPTQEQGCAIAPDGNSVVTSVGVDQTTVWLHDLNGEHQISGEGNARSPQFSADSRRVYYLWAPDLWVADLASGRTRKVLPGVEVLTYAVSLDDKGIAYSTADGSLWYSQLPWQPSGAWSTQKRNRQASAQALPGHYSQDRSIPPLQLAKFGELPHFAASGDVLFDDPRDLRAFRIRTNGTGLQELGSRFGRSSVPITAVSPNQTWAIRDTAYRDLIAYSSDNRHSQRICDLCRAGWSQNGRFFWITMVPYGSDPGLTALIPLHTPSGLPSLPLQGVRSQADLREIPNVQVVSYQGNFFGIAPAPDGSSYAFAKQESHWNLYRIPLH